MTITGIPNDLFEKLVDYLMSRPAKETYSLLKDLEAKAAQFSVTPEAKTD